MRYKRNISKCISILLIVLLTQKMGAGLYMHNWLHEKNDISATSSQSGIYAAGYNCNCIDDFCTPFSEPTPIVLQKQPEFKSDFFVVNISSYLLSPRIFHSLRAPPVIA